VFLAVVALGLSLAAAAGTILILCLLIFAMSAMNWQDSIAFSTFGAVILILPAILAARFKRSRDRPSLTGRLGRIAISPVITGALLLLTALITWAALTELVFVSAAILFRSIAWGLRWTGELFAIIGSLFDNFNQARIEVLGLTGGTLFRRGEDNAFNIHFRKKRCLSLPLKA
jgi:hypothetical protein